MGTAPYGDPVGFAYALLASPLLGPAAWAPVAAELARRGTDVVRPSRPTAAPRSWHDVLDYLMDGLPTERDLVLVPHSNAGAYVPLLVERCRVVGTVFVDAVLPPSAGHAPLAPPALRTMLRDKIDAQGLLPPWTQWWDPADTAALFEDDAARREVEREQHRLPLAYFDGQLPVPAGWDERPSAYVTFGETYAEERADAARRGWPTRTMAGSHLHMLVEPARVADVIVSLGRPPPTA